MHEAYIRLVDVEKVQHWDSRGHFFAAAAEAMRRILVEHARRKRQPRRGGNYQRLPLDDAEISVPAPTDDLLALDEALSRLELHDNLAAGFVNLRISTPYGHLVSGRPEFVDRFKRMSLVFSRQ